MTAEQNTNESMPTLRDALIKPLPVIASPAYIPNPDKDIPGIEGPNFIPNPDDHYNELRTLIADAAAWTARLYAATQDYHSDSTLDSHNAMIDMLNAYHQFIYGADQTMTEQEALDSFLTCDVWAMLETTNPNTEMPDELAKNRPELFSYFDLNGDRWY